MSLSKLADDFVICNLDDCEEACEDDYDIIDKVECEEEEKVDDGLEERKRMERIREKFPHLLDLERDQFLEVFDKKLKEALGGRLTLSKPLFETQNHPCVFIAKNLNKNLLIQVFAEMLEFLGFALRMQKLEPLFEEFVDDSRVHELFKSSLLGQRSIFLACSPRPGSNNGVKDFLIDNQVMDSMLEIIVDRLQEVQPIEEFYSDDSDTEDDDIHVFDHFNVIKKLNAKLVQVLNVDCLC